MEAAYPNQPRPLRDRLREHVAVIQSSVPDKYVSQYRNDVHFNRLVHSLTDVLRHFDRETINAAIELAASLNRESEARHVQ